MTMMTKGLLVLCASVSAIILLEISQVKCQIQKLNMAPDAFIDKYLGCADQMYDKVNSTGLLQKELSRNSKFNKQWSEAKEKWPEKKKSISLPKGFRDEYGIAIVAITGEDIHEEFNKAVSEGGKSYAYYESNFHFKSLHFYLTMGLQLLRTSCRTGETVYRGSNSQFEAALEKIRFGRFTSMSLDRKVAEEFGTASFFTMKTCLGVKIAPFSLYPKKYEVLIPLNEEFKVTKYTPQGHQFVLNSTASTCSKYNCAYLKGTFGSGSQTSRTARSADKAEKFGSPSLPPLNCRNSAPGGAGVMTSLLFSAFLVVLCLAML